MPPRRPSLVATATVATALIVGVGAAEPSSNGDVNGSGEVDLSDAIHLLSWLFLGTEPPVPIVCPEPGGGPLPVSGQRSCHDVALSLDAPCEDASYPGQDGYLRAGCPDEYRFVDHGDGTITDECTGLSWQRDTSDVNGDGEIDDGDRLTWADALRYAHDLSFAGHSDWKVPNVAELTSIADYGRASQYAGVLDGLVTPDPAAMDPAFRAETTDPYWSSTSNAREPDKAWWVFFGNGGASPSAEKRGLLFLRAVRISVDATVWGGPEDGATRERAFQNGDVNGDGVRDVSDAIALLGWLFGGSRPPVPVVCPPRGGGPLPATGQTRCYDDSGDEIPCDSPEFPGQDGFYESGCPMPGRFVDHLDGTITDTCTGLMWQRDTADVNGDGVRGDDDRLDWDEALRYSDALEFAGHSDWRLPNVRELQSIVDHGRFEPALDPVFGPGSGWTSTTHLVEPDDAWTVILATLGHNSDCQKVKAHVAGQCFYGVRAVRGGLSARSESP